MNHTCMSGMMGGSNQSLSPALKQLFDEHGPLRKQMEDFYVMAQELKGTDEQSGLQDLYEKVKQYVGELDPHSQREEGVLFPMMANYIGRETGPIAVMEYEHDQAKKNLQLFLDGYSSMNGQADQGKVDELAGYAIQAYMILTDHFMKEENVLFPMAEKMLSGQEKETLFEEINRMQG
ncbi:hemerythrin domain-containing protein [Ammoniphilus resinae]|uniref:Hemerythrin-like domain-containing protein n=1 Tax=Ammoniphilus resinae TaxID=861532 RepID=A0ABS4GTV5_9BACL|nr:hemerythrin domain-containing protein [Ammoniphilus resinae]MBP1933689.1 hemerythrin-like domain-containing protein [Ammoniphilus resinae]